MKYKVELDDYFSSVVEEPRASEYCDACCKKVHSTEAAAYTCLIKYLRDKASDYKLAILNAKRAQKAVRSKIKEV